MFKIHYQVFQGPRVKTKEVPKKVTPVPEVPVPTLPTGLQNKPKAITK